MKTSRGAMAAWTGWRCRTEVPPGASLSAGEIAAFLQGVDCYVMGSAPTRRRWALSVPATAGPMATKPVFVLTSRSLARHARHGRVLLGRPRAVADRATAAPLWPHLVAAASGRASECLRRGLADEVSCSVLPVALGTASLFFAGLTVLRRCTWWRSSPTKSGTVLLRYEVRREPEATATPVGPRRA